MKVVKDCAAAGERRGPPNLFSQVAGMGVVKVNYGSLAHIGPRTMGYTEPTATGAIGITMDHARIAEHARARPGGGRSYWHEFAEVLFHEHHHAYDMLACRCRNPHEASNPSMTVAAYEAATRERAREDTVEIASCLPD